MSNPYALYPRPIGLARLLDRNPRLAAALVQAREQSRQSGLLIEAIPERARRLVTGAAVSGKTLVFKVESAEAAHLLRLMKPELQTQLERKGLEFSEILFQAQSARPRPKVAERRVSPAAARSVLASARNIKSERLQTSLQRLARTLAEGQRR